VRPFDQYPRGGRELLGSLPHASSANALAPALEMQFVTGQTRCAYCDGSLFGEYSCSLPRLDHVVPVADADRMGFPADYSRDIINIVLCCASCRELAQRFVFPVGLRPSELTLETFASLRDNLFEERRAMVSRQETSERRAVVPLEAWDLPEAA